MITQIHRNLILALFFFLAAVLYPKFGLAAADSNVELEWEGVPEAKGYDLEVKSTKKTFKFQTTEPIWAGRLSPGFFKMRVRARDKRGVPGEWSQYQEFKVFLDSPDWINPTSGSVVTSSSSELQKMTFKWKTVFGAKKYFLEINGFDSTFNKKIELTGDSISLELPVATKFQATIRSANDVLTSNPEKDMTSEFVVKGKKIASPQINAPESFFVREIKWQKPEFVDSYYYLLEKQDAKNQKMIVVEEKNDLRAESISFKKEWSGGNYRLTVKALANYRISSDATSVRFSVKDGDRSERAEGLARLRESIDRLSGWFVTASSLVNLVEYKNLNYDLTGTQTAYEAMGSTFRFGIGYATIKNPWGYFIAAESSEVEVQGFGNIEYNSLELSSFFKMKPNDAGEFRQTAGVLYKELPDLTLNSMGTFRNSSLLSGLGLRYGVEYWHAMTSKIGVQGNAHVFPLFIKQSTTNGQKLEPTLSYQFGLLMSYRWSKNFTVLGGYAYRFDQVEYRTNPSPRFPNPQSDKNSVSQKGHYVNLFLEYQL